MKRSILIVHDDAVAARTLEGRLVGAGHAVAGVARSPSEAIELASRVTPHLILVELAAGGGASSVAAVEEIERESRTPVALVIPAADEGALRGAASPRARHCIVTPFTDRELRADVELILCRHAASRPIHDMEHRFFTISIDMVCFLGYNGYFRWLNPAWERTLGFTREELMSRPFIEFVHPDDRERTLRQNREVRGGGQALAFENRYLCKDGSYRWFRWNAAPDTAEQVIYSVARDVTASKLAEEERERLVGELQSALAEVKTLRAILPICSYCRKIRDDANYWHTVENYISRHTATQFTHSICPTCMTTEFEPRLRAFEQQQKR